MIELAAGRIVISIMTASLQYYNGSRNFYYYSVTRGECSNPPETENCPETDNDILNGYFSFWSRETQRRQKAELLVSGVEASGQFLSPLWQYVR